MRYLIVSKDLEFFERLSLAIEVELGLADIFHAEQLQDAANFFNSNFEFDLAFTDLDQASFDLFQKLAFSKNKKIKIIQCTGSESTVKDKHASYLLNKNKISQAIKEIFKIVNILKSEKDLANISPETNAGKSQYAGVGLQTLLRLGTLPSDVYLKLNKDKYLKMFMRGNFFIDDDYNNVLNKGVTRLYILRSDAHHYINIVQSEIKNLKSIQQSEILENLNAINQIILNSFDFLELSPEVQKRGAEITSSIVKSLEKNDQIGNYMAKILQTKGPYLPTHTSLLVLFTLDIIKYCSWRTDEIAKKLVMASLLHDIGLEEYLDEHTCMHRFDDLHKTEKEIFFNHPIRSLKLAKTMKNVSLDLERLILEHHEKPDGTGFPRGLDAKNIQPLSALFIIAHHFVDLVWQAKENNEKYGPEIVVKSFDKIYHSGAYLKIWEEYKKGKKL